MWSTKTKQILKKLFNAVPFFKLDPKNWCLLPVSKLAQFFQVRNQSFSLQRKKKKITNYIFHLLSAIWKTSCIARIKEYQRNSENIPQLMCRDTISPLWLPTCGRFNSRISYRQLVKIMQTLFSCWTSYYDQELCLAIVQFYLIRFHPSPYSLYALLHSF